MRVKSKKHEHLSQLDYFRLTICALRSQLFQILLNRAYLLNPSLVAVEFI